VLACYMAFQARGTLINYLGGYTLFGRALWNQAYSNPNDLAATALLALGMALALITNPWEIRIVRWGCAAAAAVLIAIIFLTQSRGAFLGMVLGVGPVALAQMWKRPIMILVVVAVAAAGTVFVPDAVWKRLSGIGKLTDTATIAQADPEGSAAQRWEIQKTAFRIVGDHPLTGIGWGCYPFANKLYSPVLGARDTHDTYLNLAAELGLPGLLLWLGLVAAVFRRWGERRKFPAVSQSSADVSAVQGVWIRCAVVGFLVAGIFGSYSGITLIYLVMGMMWAAGTIAMIEAPPLSTKPTAH